MKVSYPAKVEISYKYKSSVINFAKVRVDGLRFNEYFSMKYEKSFAESVGRPACSFKVIDPPWVNIVDGETETEIKISYRVTLFEEQGEYTNIVDTASATELLNTNAAIYFFKIFNVFAGDEKFVELFGELDNPSRDGLDIQVAVERCEEDDTPVTAEPVDAVPSTSGTADVSGTTETSGTADISGVTDTSSITETSAAAPRTTTKRKRRKHTAVNN